MQARIVKKNQTLSNRQEALIGLRYRAVRAGKLARRCRGLVEELLHKDSCDNM